MYLYASIWAMCRGEYFSFYLKLFPDGHFFPLNSSLKMNHKFQTLFQYYRLFYSFSCQGRVSMSENGFPAREGFPCQGRVSLPGQGLPSRKVFRCDVRFSLLGKNFPISEGFSSQGNSSLLGKGFPTREVEVSLPEMTTYTGLKIGKLFPEVPKTRNFSRMEYPLILKNIHPCHELKNEW